MPRKKREIRRDYLRAGYREEQGKGDHTKYRYLAWSKPLLWTAGTALRHESTMRAI